MKYSLLSKIERSFGEQKMTISHWAAIFSCILLLGVGVSQAADLRVQPTDIKDTRCGGKWGSSLDITFNLFGDDLEHGRAVRCNLTKAVDETGRELIETEKGKMHGMSRNGDFQPSNEELTDREQISVQLKNPSRKATVVTEISGEIEIYKPNNDPQCVLLVKDLAGKEKKPLSDPLLTDNKIEITLMPPKAAGGEKVAPCEPCVPAVKPSADPAPKPSAEPAPLPPAEEPKETKALPEKAKEAGDKPAKPDSDAAKESTDESAEESAADDSDENDPFPDEAKKAAPAPIAKAMGGALEQAFSHMFGGGGDENSFQLTIKDPANKLVKIEFLDEEDQVISNNGVSSCNDDHWYSFSQPLPKNVKLRIYVATEKSIVKVPFTLKDVALP